MLVAASQTVVRTNEPSIDVSPFIPCDEKSPGEEGTDLCLTKASGLQPPVILLLRGGDCDEACRQVNRVVGGDPPIHSIFSLLHASMDHIAGQLVGLDLVLHHLDMLLFRLDAGLDHPDISCRICSSSR